MPRRRSDPADLSLQSGRLVWARSYARYPSSAVAASIQRWNEHNYKAHETGARGRKGIPPEDLLKYAKAFGVDLQWLAFGIGSPLPNIEAHGDDVVSPPADWLKRPVKLKAVA